MDVRRFDTLTRLFADRSSRRAAVLGGLAAVAGGLGASRAGRLGLAQEAGSPAASPAASPLASPAASPGPLDLLAGTPAAGAELLGRDGGACKGSRETCATDPSIALGQAVPDSYASSECCSGICAKRVGRIVVWSCE